MSFYKWFMLILAFNMASGCANNGCYNEDYIFNGSKFAVGYLSDVEDADVKNHSGVMEGLGDEVFGSKEAMLDAGYTVVNCNMTPRGVQYCSGVKSIQEIRVREICHRHGSVCNDGTYSSSRGRGTCSHHGGVAY